MEIKPIKNDKDYREALAMVSRLIDQDPAPDTPQADTLEVLGTLVQAWEAEHFSIDAPSAVEAIRFRMEQMGLSVADLQPIFGRSNRAYEVLNGVRPLSVSMMRRLHAQLDIPLETLFKEPESKAENGGTQPRRKTSRAESRVSSK